MQEQLRYLVELQILENKKNELLRDREATPGKLSALDKEFSTVESEYLLKKADYEHAVQLHRSLETEIADLEARIKRSKQKEREVKSNREYQALLKEIEELKEEVASREDHALELMEKIESARGELEAMEKEVSELKEKIDAQKARLQEESERVSEKIDRLNELQAAVRAKVDPDLLKRWDFLIGKQKGIAVAPVEKGVCQICHLNIPPQRFIELQRDESILTCPHCHRFLYWPGHEDYQVMVEDLETV
ncbi:hypothetical protein SAMN02746041_01896 [Desulfacinum hydrothermale DSM 13146]|uniref:Uncharacterized protein n=1 Tax=Desulfacinum hydrothermale DSM 13146 TaxID=1121390 RepID=A0A1W1XJQ4_9BACT|nr:C4-type zinc ribbon domain-containing protein [Desulfacinum hydrothermale]SMC23994.1 hypothetical protein SAMN02746041_01896 [Desulfacinum hydrothermale DSM 13146]